MAGKGGLFVVCSSTRTGTGSADLQPIGSSVTDCQALTWPSILCYVTILFSGRRDDTHLGRTALSSLQIKDPACVRDSKGGHASCIIIKVVMNAKSWAFDFNFQLSSPKERGVPCTLLINKISSCTDEIFSLFPMLQAPLLPENPLLGRTDRQTEGIEARRLTKIKCEQSGTQAERSEKTTQKLPTCLLCPAENSRARSDKSISHAPHTVMVWSMSTSTWKWMDLWLE